MESKIFGSFQGCLLAACNAAARATAADPKQALHSGIVSAKGKGFTMRVINASEKPSKGDLAIATPCEALVSGEKSKLEEKAARVAKKEKPTKAKKEKAANPPKAIAKKGRQGKSARGREAEVALPAPLRPREMVQVSQLAPEQLAAAREMFAALIKRHRTPEIALSVLEFEADLFAGSVDVDRRDTYDRAIAVVAHDRQLQQENHDAPTASAIAQPTALIPAARGARRSGTSARVR